MIPIFSKKENRFKKWKTLFSCEKKFLKSEKALSELTNTVKNGKIG